MGISSPLVDLQHQYDLLQKEYEYEKETTEDAHKPLSPNEIKIDIDF